MKKLLFSILLGSSACAMLSGCASAEERAKVTKALEARDYKIAVNRMYPMKGSSRSVSYGYSVEVRNDSLISYLPYFGGAYNVPYGGGKGLNFSERIGSYRESQKNNGERQIEINVTNEEDTYIYLIKVFSNGNSSIDVTSRQRDHISYSGELEVK